MQPLAAPRVGCQRNRLGDVILDVAGDELGKPDGNDRLAPTRPANVSPAIVSTGHPAHSASLPVVCALYGQRVEEQIRAAIQRQVFGIRAFGANSSRAGSTPRAAASRRKFAIAGSPSRRASSHNTASGTRRRIVAHASNTSGFSF